MYMDQSDREDSTPDWVLNLLRREREADERISRMTPEEQAELQRQADDLGERMQSSYGP